MAGNGKPRKGGKGGGGGGGGYPESFKATADALKSQAATAFHSSVRSPNGAYRDSFEVPLYVPYSGNFGRNSPYPLHLGTGYKPVFVSGRTQRLTDQYKDAKRRGANDDALRGLSRSAETSFRKDFQTAKERGVYAALHRDS